MRYGNFDTKEGRVDEEEWGVDFFFWFSVTEFVGSFSLCSATHSWTLVLDIPLSRRATRAVPKQCKLVLFNASTKPRSSNSCRLNAKFIYQLRGAKAVPSPIPSTHISMPTTNKIPTSQSCTHPCTASPCLETYTIACHRGLSPINPTSLPSEFLLLPSRLTYMYTVPIHLHHNHHHHHHRHLTPLPATVATQASIPSSGTEGRGGESTHR
jgi:hypothetical protein